ARRFAEREVLPHLDAWERAGRVPRELHLSAGRAGLLGLGLTEGDLIDSAAVTEGLILAGASSGLIAALFSHASPLPHMPAAADAGHLERYVLRAVRGEKTGALAVTEPDGGSDVAAIRTRAVRDGDRYVINGAKTYITSGARADFVTTAARTGDEIS